MHQLLVLESAVPFVGVFLVALGDVVVYPFQKVLSLRNCIVQTQMSVFGKCAFVLGELFANLAGFANLLSQFFQWSVGFKIGIGGFEDALVLIIEVNDSFEMLVSGGVG